jgi:hypothetical protein
MPEYITNAGLAILANRIKGQGTEPIYLAWGTGATAADPTATALDTEASEARVACVSSIETVSQTDDAYKVTGAITADGSKTITEWGIFDASSGGNLLAIKSISPGDDYTVGEIGAFSFRIQFARPA